MSQSITKEEVLKAQEGWGNGVVAIGKAFTDKGDFAAVATDHVDNLYAYGLTDVLFKPTKAVVEQFRPTKESAVSYFVASNGVCKEDKGFALQPWTKVRFENAESFYLLTQHLQWVIISLLTQMVMKQS